MRSLMWTPPVDCTAQETALLAYMTRTRKLFGFCRRWSESAEEMLVSEGAAGSAPVGKGKGGGKGKGERLVSRQVV